MDSYDVGGNQVPGILVFNRLDNGNQAPKRSITGSNTQFGTFTNYVTLDIANGELFAQGDDGAGIVVFNLHCSGSFTDPFSKGEGQIFRRSARAVAIAALARRRPHNDRGNCG